MAIGTVIAPVPLVFIFGLKINSFFLTLLVLYGLFACAICVYLEVSEKNTHDKKLHIIFLIFTAIILIMLLSHIYWYGQLKEYEFLMNHLSSEEKLKFFFNTKALKETFPFL